MNEQLQNQVKLSGRVLDDLHFSHCVHQEEFYQFTLASLRTSGYEDQIPITISGKLLRDENKYQGQHVYINGQVRTYNQSANGRSKLLITVFARGIEKPSKDSRSEKDSRDDHDDINQVELEGFLCKKPIFRVSPLGREISDLMIAVNRMYGKSDYLPCIAWGRNAKYAQNMDVGEKIKIAGRIQSREYKKKSENGEITLGIAREISVVNLELLDLAFVSQGMNT